MQTEWQDNLNVGYHFSIVLQQYNKKKKREAAWKTTGANEGEKKVEWETSVLQTPTGGNRGVRASSSLHYLEMITFPGLILLHVLYVILVVETIVLGSQI